MKHDSEEYKKFFQSLSPSEIQEANEKNHLEHLRQSEAFKKGYEKEVCYLCNKPFKTISSDNPCLHWLLRQCKFKKKDFEKVYSKYSYHNMAAFLRWCANQEKMLSNINDLKEEKSERKILSYTIKWKNIEWTFDCSKNDFNGHTGTTINFPHYHFQMRIDGRQFINFNDFHIPFTDEDLFNITLKENASDWFRQDFGAIGSGMQDAVDIPHDLILEHTVSTQDESEATYHFSTIVEALDNPISGEELYEMQQESLRTGKSMAYIMKHRLKGRANVSTIISPADSIPDIANRTEHQRKA